MQQDSTRDKAVSEIARALMTRTEREREREEEEEEQLSYAMAKVNRCERSRVLLIR